MKCYIVSALAVLAVASCSAGKPATPAAAVYAARATYDATVLAPAARYAQLPTCPVAATGAPCASPSVVASLRKADAAAKAALDAAEDTVRVHPELDATAAVAAADNAIKAAAIILATYAPAQGGK